MNRWARLAVLSGVATALTGWAAVPAAVAGPPQVQHSQVNVSLTGIDVCGVTVNSVIHGTDTFVVFTDAAGDVRIQDESHVVSTLTNPVNGHVVHVSASARDAQPYPVSNPDGSTTFTDTLTGSPIRVYTDHSNVLVKDVGFVSIVDTVDADGDLLNEQVIVHGVHQASGQDEVFCNAVASALG